MIHINPRFNVGHPFHANEDVGPELKYCLNVGHHLFLLAPIATSDKMRLVQCLACHDIYLLPERRRVARRLVLQGRRKTDLP